MGRFISAATTVIEDISGPVVQRTFDEWYTGGTPRIQLNNYPIVGTPTLVTETYSSQVVWTLTYQPIDGSVGGDSKGYTFDAANGILMRRALGVAMPFAKGERNIHVQYTAGMCADTASVPPNVALAALELIRINWQPVQAGNIPNYGAGAGGSAGYESVDVTDPLKLGFFVPNRVLEILKPNANRFAIA